MSDLATQSPRRNPRHNLSVTSAVSQPKSVRVIDAPLYDLSVDGCKLISPEPFAEGTPVMVKIHGLEPWPASVVWSDEHFVGIEFAKPLSPYVVDHYVGKFGPA